MLVAAWQDVRAQQGEEDTCNEVGQGWPGRLLTHWRIDQGSKDTKTKGLKCSLLEKEATHMKREKLRMNSVVLDWNRSHWCKVVDFHIYNGIKINRYKRLSVLLSTHIRFPSSAH